MLRGTNCDTRISRLNLALGPALLHAPVPSPGVDAKRSRRRAGGPARSRLFRRRLTAETPPLAQRFEHGTRPKQRCEGAAEEPRRKKVRIHCHRCGATLRRPDQLRRLAAPAAVYVCRDEDRCGERVKLDPVTGRSAQPARVRVKNTDCNGAASASAQPATKFAGHFPTAPPTRSLGRSRRR